MDQVDVTVAHAKTVVRIARAKVRLSRDVLEADLSGPAVRISDVMQLTGLSRNKIKADVRLGYLAVVYNGCGGIRPWWFFERREVVRYLNALRVPRGTPV
jgi:hypothetical protein